MSHAEKLYRKAKQNLKNIRFEELDILLRSAGFEVRQPHGGSSHYFYKKGRRTITVPRHRPFVGSVYVKNALEILKEDFEDE